MHSSLQTSMIRPQSSRWLPNQLASRHPWGKISLNDPQKRVVSRLPRPEEVGVHLPLVGPQFHPLAGDL